MVVLKEIMVIEDHSTNGTRDTLGRSGLAHG
jgi:hypothetical protein